MRDRLYLGAGFCCMAGCILAITAAGATGPWVIGLTAGAGVCFIATGILLTIGRRV